MNEDTDSIDYGKKEKIHKIGRAGSTRNKSAYVNVKIDIKDKIEQGSLELSPEEI